jgi:polyribonucleotide nucleotidyltransferase
VTDEINEGDTVIVKILDVDNRGRVKLSMREVTEEEKAVFADGESVNVEG